MLRGDHITGVFVAQIKQFDKMFIGTVFPPFADPEAQANRVAQDYWDQKMSEPCGPDGPDDDPGDIADDAHQKSLDFYETMTAMHHTVLNLFAAGVFHLFEQQAGTLLQDWTGTRPKFPFSALEELLKNKNGPAIDVNAAPMWSRVNELRLVANVVKHSEGDSADKLRAVNDAYFKLPAVRGTDLEKHFGGDHTIVALGVDTLTCWSTGPGGWRPADRWLRGRYTNVRNSVMTPNGLAGSMGLNGMSVLIASRPALLVCGTST